LMSVYCSSTSCAHAKLTNRHKRFKSPVIRIVDHWSTEQTECQNKEA
jgi:hypothetical protein